VLISLYIVKQSELTHKRDRLASHLPDVSHVLRGSLLERIIRHRSGCPKCDRGEGHPVAGLAVGYPGQRTRQISLRKEQVPEVKRCLANYQKLKAVIEEIRELNQQLLRAEPDEGEQPGAALSDSSPALVPTLSRRVPGRSQEEER
jgi:hypothetical protein